MARQVGQEGRVVVYDINGEMLREGKKKCVDRGVLRGLDFVQGNAEAISFPDNTFHAVTVGFGVRNVTHLEQAFREMTRVVKPGGRVVCLEFSHVKNPVMKKLYDAYSFSFIPAVGERVTGNRSAYEYLPESIRLFPKQEELREMMLRAGLYKVWYRNVFGGIAALHIGVKV
jgi:demethylmenaquinone methyltransferase/2-methoxy-6-polyprenyl-1,4-benzoquinol methylase